MGGGSLNVTYPKGEGDQKFKLGFGEGHTIFFVNISVYLNK